MCVYKKQKKNKKKFFKWERLQHASKLLEINQWRGRERETKYSGGIGGRRYDSYRASF